MEHYIIETDIISYYLLPVSVALKSVIKHMNIKKCKNKYTSKINLSNFIFGYISVVIFFIQFQSCRV